MPVKTPSFWYRAAEQKSPLQEKLLGCLSPLYNAAHKFNQSRKEYYKASIPVICIGNAVAGGSGKTPTAIAMNALLGKYALKSAPYFLTRGYQSSFTKPTLVDTKNHTYKEAGDESLLLARHAPTIISPNRATGAQLAEISGADCIIMDDGLQNASLFKNITFMVIDGMGGFGNMKTLPAGPLREDLKSGFAKTDAFIVVGLDKRNISSLLPHDKPLFHARVEAGINALPDKQKPVLAFCGLGQPDKFYRFLIDLGYNIQSWHAYADHHKYTAEELATLTQIAARDNLQILTTEKDYMRLIGSGYEPNIRTVPITINFEEETALAAFLQEKLAP